MTPDLERLMGEAKRRYHTEPAFHARVKLAIRVEDEITRRPLDTRTERHDQLERVVTVLHALDQEEEFRASIRYLGEPL